MGELVSAHFTLASISEALSPADGEPRGPEAEAGAKAVDFAFQALLAAPCRTLDDARTKVGYILRSEISDGRRLLDGLTLDGVDTWAPASPIAVLLRSILGAPRASPAPTT